MSVFHKHFVIFHQHRCHLDSLEIHKELDIKTISLFGRGDATGDFDHFNGGSFINICTIGVLILYLTLQFVIKTIILQV
jgi:hypothetical protein